MEKDTSEEAIQALRNLVLLIGSLTTCGFIELKPSSSAANSSLFKLPGFAVPQPAGSGKGLNMFYLFWQVRGFGWVVRLGLLLAGR